MNEGKLINIILKIHLLCIYKDMTSMLVEYTGVIIYDWELGNKDLITRAGIEYKADYFLRSDSKFRDVLPIKEGLVYINDSIFLYDDLNFMLVDKFIKKTQGNAISLHDFKHKYYNRMYK